MSFRERPEYTDWRGAVFARFGRKCILCGHSSNITAHHIRPVKEYPELAFETTNGVPLCGNYHADVNGWEMDYVEEFESRQTAILEGRPLHFGGATQLEDELRKQAYADPSDAEVVQNWFATSGDAEEVVAFYNQHRRAFRKTPMIYLHLACHLQSLGRHSDAAKVADAALACAERDGTVREHIADIAALNYENLRKCSRLADAAAFLADQTRRFPNEAILHMYLARALWPKTQHFPVRKDEPMSDECAWHALEAARLDPDDQACVRRGILAAIMKGRWLTGLSLVHRLLESPDTDAESAVEILDLFFPGCFQRADRDFNQYCKTLAGTSENHFCKAKLAHCMWLVHRRQSARELALDCLSARSDDLLASYVLQRLERA